MSEQKPIGNIKPDTEKTVYFYENPFYCLSNFSSFALKRHGEIFPTLEHAYHWEKFNSPNVGKSNVRLHESVQRLILEANSAHVAFKIAHEHESLVREDWMDIRENVMLTLMCCKVLQHEYVKKKLLETGNREIIEDSWRDDFWGWGPNKDGSNIAGKCWMKVRDFLINPQRVQGYDFDDLHDKSIEDLYKMLEQILGDKTITNACDVYFIADHIRVLPNLLHLAYNHRIKVETDPDSKEIIMSFPYKNFSQEETRRHGITFFGVTNNKEYEEIFKIAVMQALIVKLSFREQIEDWAGKSY